MTNEETKIASELEERICQIAMSSSPSVAIVALSTTLGIIFCNQTRLETITEAVDSWRETSAIIEKLIRAKFGELRHGD